MIKYTKYIVGFFIVSCLYANINHTKRYDVLKYSLKLNIDMNNGSLNGANTICFFPDSSLDYVVFHSSGLKIFGVNSGEEKLEYKLIPEEEKLIVYKKCKSMDTVYITINYEYDKEKNRAEDRKGVYFFKKDNEVLENLLYTMAEPSDARSWYPCWDEPNDKVLTDIEVRVNRGYSVASNGLLLNKNDDTDSTTVFSWKTNYPITTYLVSLAVSKYSKFSDYYHKITRPQDSVEIVYYVWQPDSAGVIFNAVKSFEKVSSMIGAFSLKFGEYPFEKYGMAAVFPFNFGGEEHQSMTTIHRYWLCGEEMGIAHELAHQWWGDMITCATWKDIWLNESFATYSEYIWLESRTNSAEELKKKLTLYARFGTDWSKAIYNPEGQGIKLFSDIVYQKGALVLHTLRNIIGDVKFFEVLNEYRTRFKYSYAHTKEFIDIVNNVTGDNYQWFFDQYIYGIGYPQIKYKWEYNEVEKEVKIELEQIQPSDWPIYRLPIELKIVSKESAVKKVLMDGKKRKEVFIFKNISRPQSVDIDPEKKIFMKIIKNK